MQPAQRPRVSSRASPPSSSADAADQRRRRGRGFLSARRRFPARQPHLADNDEVLPIIFATVPDLDDLVRCAYTCRRWLRVVSAESASICGTPRRRGRRSSPSLALGFFHGSALFVPNASATRRFPGLLQEPPSLRTLVDEDGLLHGAFDIVASRNDYLVVGLQRRANGDRRLNLSVCNPMAGEVHALPPLEGIGLHYACTVLTADDRKTTDPPRPSSYFCVVMLYSRQSFTAFRSYSSDGGRWSEEKEVTGAAIHTREMGETCSGVVGPGGRLVYWLTKNSAHFSHCVFMLSLQTLQLWEVPLPSSGNGFKLKLDVENTLLGLSPEGRLCAIQFGGHPFLLMEADRRISIRVTTRTHSGWDNGVLIQVQQSLPADVTKARLRWFCEKSGVVFFSVVAGDTGHQRSNMYALSLKTHEVEMLVSLERDRDRWQQVYGYEMNQAAYLASLAQPEGMEDM
ncbi:unnamed protein product [Urochloa humidicola]